MKIHLVGGAVRDKLLGLKPRDEDFLVTNGSSEEMLKHGFIEVGKSHTVYLHPVTKEEYTLASDLRMDLERRDLTINAMAMDGEQVIDYFGGMKDLENKILRHIRNENFYSDPLRVYRVARFASQFPDFQIDPETLILMNKVAQTRPFIGLDGERIFQELQKVLSSADSEKFFLTLHSIDVLKLHFGELNPHDLKYLQKSHSPLLRYGTLFLYKDISFVNTVSDRLKVPNEWREIARLSCELLSRLKELSHPEAVINLFQDFDIFRRPNRLDVMGELFCLIGENEIAHKLKSYYDITSKITYQDLSDTHLEGKAIGESIKNLRIKALGKMNF